MNSAMKKKAITLALISALIVIGIVGYTMEHIRTTRVNRDLTRAFDLMALQSGLERYFIGHQKFPLADKPLNAQGATSCSQEWATLAETLNTTLPKDPQQNCSTQWYAYRSDGKNYKIIAFPEQCDRNIAQQLNDPTRPCSTDGGAWMRSSTGATLW